MGSRGKTSRGPIFPHSMMISVISISFEDITRGPRRQDQRFHPPNLFKSTVSDLSLSNRWTWARKRSTIGSRLVLRFATDPAVSLRARQMSLSGRAVARPRTLNTLTHGPSPPGCPGAHLSDNRRHRRRGGRSSRPAVGRRLTGGSRSCSGSSKTSVHGQ